jgi:hypothetical protein
VNYIKVKDKFGTCRLSFCNAGHLIFALKLGILKENTATLCHVLSCFDGSYLVLGEGDRGDCTKDLSVLLHFVQYS